MVHFRITKLFAFSVILLSSLLSLPPAQSAIVHASNAHDQRAPDVPANLRVPDGNRVEFHAFATGVQIYVWTVTATGPSWVFRAPEATLYDSDGDIVGTHFAGPTWESNSGSRVVGVVWHRSAVSNAIPWLLLNATAAEPPGIFARTTYIQRVNTAGGLAPVLPGTSIGEEACVPYTAEYFFYRAQS